jgi:pilus assembly protein CpaE
VLLVDMDCCYGGAGAFLGLSGSYGLADALAHMHQPDPQLITSSATPHNERLHVLLSPASVNFRNPSPLALANLGNMVEACRQAYSLVVIDCPRADMPLAETLAMHSSKTLLLMQMTVKDIRAARDMRKSLLAGGVDPADLVSVINRYHKRQSPISLTQCLNALGSQQVELLSNDWSSAVSGINFGQPLSQSAPMSPLRKDLRKLADQTLRLWASPVEGAQ